MPMRSLLLTVVFMLVTTTSAANATANAPISVPPPTKVQCIDNVRATIGEPNQQLTVCLFVDIEKRLSVAAVDKNDLSYDHASLTVSSALSILANPDVSILHPVLLKSAGEGLEQLRLQELEDIKQRDFKSPFNESSMVSLNPGAIGRLIDKSNALIRLGYLDLALDTVKQVMAKFEAKLLEKKGKALSDEQQWRWLSFRTTYLRLVMAKGDAESAISGYRDLIGDNLIIPKYRTNAKVNLAAFLAESGRFKEAKALIDEAKAEFDLQTETYDHYKLSGSERHFAWIQACALHGLDRANEAKPLIALVLASPEKPVDFYADIYSTSSIERRMYNCMGDVERMVSFVKSQPNHPLYGQMSNLYLQPALTLTNARQNAFLRKVQAHPEMVAKAKSAVILPLSLTPALNRWQ